MKRLVCGMLVVALLGSSVAAVARDRSSLPTDIKKRADAQRGVIPYDRNNPPGNPYGGAALVSVLPERSAAAYRRAALPRRLSKSDICTIDTKIGKKRYALCGYKGKIAAVDDTALMTAAGHPGD